VIHLNIIGVGVKNMKINLEINNTTESPIEEGFFEAIAEKTFAELKYDFLNPSTDGREVGISIAFIAPAEIRKINKEYRKYDSVTDILSFPEYENVGQIEKAATTKLGEELFLGELILCYDDIKEYTQKEKIDLEKEIAEVVSHGILHLLGFEHGEKMFALQKLVADKLIK